MFQSWLEVTMFSLTRAPLYKFLSLTLKITGNKRTKLCLELLYLNLELGRQLSSRYHIECVIHSTCRDPNMTHFFQTERISYRSSFTGTEKIYKTERRLLTPFLNTIAPHTHDFNLCGATTHACAASQVTRVRRGFNPLRRATHQ